MTAASAPYDVESLAETRLSPLIQALAKLARERAAERDAAVREARLAREERDTLRELFKVSLDHLYAVTLIRSATRASSRGGCSTWTTSSIVR